MRPPPTFRYYFQPLDSSMLLITPSTSSVLDLTRTFGAEKTVAGSLLVTVTSRYDRAGQECREEEPMWVVPNVFQHFRILLTRNLLLPNTRPVLEHILVWLEGHKFPEGNNSPAPPPKGAPRRKQLAQMPWEYLGALVHVANGPRPSEAHHPQWAPLLIRIGEILLGEIYQTR